MDKCPLSPHQAEVVTLQSTDVDHVTCEACSTYRITYEARLELAGTSSRVAGREYILSGLARRGSEEGRPITISTENVDDLLASVVPPRDPQEVLDRIISYVGAKAPSFDDGVNLAPENDYPIGFARNAEEHNYCIAYGTSTGLIKTNRGIVLTPEGWRRFNELSGTQIDSSQAFVAMWFDPSLDAVWKEGFKPALEQTGYDALRIDQREFNDKIDDRIIAEIRRSGRLVADVTGHRGGVYFEAGFALGLGIQVIWTCREDALEEVHFDTRQYPHIVWENLEQLKQKLVNRIDGTGLSRIRPPSSLGRPPDA